MEVVQLLESQGFWQHQVLRGLAAGAAGNTVLYKGMGTSIGQYALVFLPGESPPWQRSLAGHSLQGHKELDITKVTQHAKTQDFFFFFACVSSALVRVEHGGGTAAWLPGTCDTKCAGT